MTKIIDFKYNESIYFNEDKRVFEDLYQEYSVEKILWMLEDFEYNEIKSFHSYDFYKTLEKYYFNK